MGFFPAEHSFSHYFCNTCTSVLVWGLNKISYWPWDFILPESPQQPPKFVRSKSHKRLCDVTDVTQWQVALYEMPQTFWLLLALTFFEILKKFPWVLPRTDGNETRKGWKREPMMSDCCCWRYLSKTRPFIHHLINCFLLFGIILPY